MKTIVMIALFTGLLGTGYAQVSNSSADETAIRTTIEGETEAGLSGAVMKEASYWRQVPYATWVGSYLNKIYYAKGFENIHKLMMEAADSLKLHPVVKHEMKNSEYEIRISGNAAFVTYIQSVKRGEDPVGLTRENRYLEKNENEWKIVNITWLVYDPK